MRLVLPGILLSSSAITALAGSAAAQVSNQSFEITVETARPTLGDTVVLNFRVRLDERDLLFDTLPQPIGALPPGVRVLGVDKLYRTPDRIFHGQGRLAFYRPGRQAIPQFGLPFMRAVKGVQRATLTSDPAHVEIVSLLPPGNPSLKDIRELQRSPAPPVLPFVAGALGIAGLLLLYLRRRRRQGAAPQLSEPEPVEPAARVLSHYERAALELERIERQRWPDQGEVALHYQSVTDVLRDYLEAAESVPAKERTSAEVLWSLPPHLTQSGMRDRFRGILGQADLVKFARLSPHPPEADEFLDLCRGLLDRWHESSLPSALSHAVR
jgi:hypothetical protein